MTTTISCGCGKTWPIATLDKCPWERLEIGGRLRCWDCKRELAVAAQCGAGVEELYTQLPSTSLGALKKLDERLPLKEVPGLAEDLNWDDNAEQQA